MTEIIKYIFLKHTSETVNVQSFQKFIMCHMGVVRNERKRDDANSIY